MAESAQRFDWIPKLARWGLVCSIVLLCLAIVATAVTGVALTLDHTLMAAGVAAAATVVALLLEICLALGAFVLYGLIGVWVSGEAATRSVVARLDPIETLLESQADSAKKLLDLVALSDQAKSLIYRDRELEALREVIHEDLMRQDYQTVEAMIDAIEKRFGFADEAARLRAQVQASKKATLEEKVDTAVNRIQDLINRHDWARAVREAQRIVKMFPGNAKAEALPERVESARTQHKRSLLQEYGEAVRKNDVDHGIELLRELDRYLTPQEGAALAESARGVFRAKLNNLGVQFAIHVNDGAWAAAVATGEQIVSEFPNTRMAQEVREKMDQLKARASAK